MTDPQVSIYPFPHPQAAETRLLRAAAECAQLRAAFTHLKKSRHEMAEYLRGAQQELDMAAHSFCIEVDSAWAEYIETTGNHE